MTESRRIARVAIATPLRRAFDYLLPAAIRQKAGPGWRVLAPFGRGREAVGIILQCRAQSEYPADKLKAIIRLMDDEPVLDPPQLEWILWAGRYYHHPVGEVVFNALPARLRKKQALDHIQPACWGPTEAGRAFDPARLKKSPRQARLLDHLRQQQGPAHESELGQALGQPLAQLQRTLHALRHKGLIVRADTPAGPDIKKGRRLNEEQARAVNTVLAAPAGHGVFLLDGVTGSGKTEVYLALLEPALRAGRQCLLLLPEIGLIPQLIRRCRARFNSPIAVLHSGLTELERAQSWRLARSGEAGLVLGARSAVWTPLARPGLYIIDEEHDLSYKQQDGFRYHARDMLIKRAARDGVKIILGSATPSLESLLNAGRGRYTRIRLTRRAGPARPPAFRLLDIRGRRMQGALSQELVREIGLHLAAGNQALLFLNRRGYAAHLYCHQCAWHAACHRCERPYTYHKKINSLCCHHCGGRQRPRTRCPACDQALLFLGHGTERIEEELGRLFPAAAIARIDRDTAQGRAALTRLLAEAQSARANILLGTQMLAKGHHFPAVTLTAIIDADRGLFSADFRAGERLAQLLTQVSGRAGRGDKPGAVTLQTHYPGHALLHAVTGPGYVALAAELLRERQLSRLPPFTCMALLRAEAPTGAAAEQFLGEALSEFKRFGQPEVELYGPLPALIEKRGGRWRYQLLLQAPDRPSLHQNLDAWLGRLETLKAAGRVRWSLDIDPQDMS